MPEPKPRTTLTTGTIFVPSKSRGVASTLSAFSALFIWVARLPINFVASSAFCPPAEAARLHRTPTVTHHMSPFCMAHSPSLMSRTWSCSLSPTRHGPLVSPLLPHACQQHRAKAEEAEDKPDDPAQKRQNPHEAQEDAPNEDLLEGRITRALHGRRGCLSHEQRYTDQPKQLQGPGKEHDEDSQG